MAECGPKVSAIADTVPGMTNPFLLRQIAEQHQREILMANRARRLVPSHPRIRARLGWSLVVLGMRLAHDAHARDPMHWNRASA